MKGRVTLVSLALVVAAQVWAGDDPFAFMPDGGRGAFLRAFPDAGAQRDALVDRAVVADLGGLADDDTHAVIDEEAATNGGARVNLNPSPETGDLRAHTS